MTERASNLAAREGEGSSLVSFMMVYHDINVSKALMSHVEVLLCITYVIRSDHIISLPPCICRSVFVLISCHQHKVTFT